jgi:hypothetical protein
MRKLGMAAAAVLAFTRAWAGDDTTSQDRGTTATPPQGSTEEQGTGMSQPPPSDSGSPSADPYSGAAEGGTGSASEGMGSQAGTAAGAPSDQGTKPGNKSSDNWNHEPMPQNAAIPETPSDG